MKLRLAHAIVSLILIPLLAGCTGAPTETLPEPRIVYGLTLMPTGFDPHINASSELGIPLRSVYDTLVYLDPTSGEFVPGLATRWELSADGLSTTFYLRSDIHFHDGTVFNAQAVAANLDRITAPETASQKAAFMLGPYAGYEVIDEFTIRLNFSEPYAPLLDSLSQVYLGIASPTQLSRYDAATYQYHQIGTGPYRMVEYVPGDRFVITRSDDYAWGPSFYTAPANPVRTIEFRFFEDAPTRALALESGDAQVMGELLPVDAQLLVGNPAIRLYPVSRPGQPVQFLLNTQRFPTDSPLIRQALLFATNRAAIVDTVFRRFAPIAYGPLSQATQFYNPDVNGAYAFNSEEARRLLQSAGFSETDADGTLILPGAPTASTEEPGQPTPATEAVEASGIPLRLMMVIPPWSQYPAIAQMIQSQWRDVGIDLEIRQVANFNQLNEAAGSGDYHLIGLNFSGRDPSLMNQFFLSDAPLNWTGYVDTELDTFLHEGARLPDPALRQQNYHAAQRRIMEQAIILPIADYANLNGASTTLENVSFDAQGWFPLLYNFSVTETSGE